MLEHAGLDKGAVDGYLDAKHSKETIATPDTDARTIVEYSSGSTVISLSIISRIFGISDVRAYLSNKTSDAKLKMMRFFGLDLYVLPHFPFFFPSCHISHPLSPFRPRCCSHRTLFGGPSQPEPLDPRGGIHAAVEEGHKAGHYNPNQYENPNNWGAHVRWTGKQIFTQLPEIDIFCAGMGYV